MRVLLDTNVVSELQRSKPNSRVVEAVNALPTSDTFLSAITIGELVFGIARLPAGKKRQELEHWLLSVEHRYRSQMLAVDAEVARIWGEITALNQTQGNTIPIQDGLIAATAIRHGLHLMTRNVRNFQCLGALVINPWS